MELDALETEPIENNNRRPWWRRLWRILWITVVSVIALLVLQVVLYKWVNPPLTPLMVQRFFQQVKDKDREVNFERDYVSIDEISPNMVTAVISSEFKLSHRS